MENVKPAVHKSKEFIRIEFLKRKADKLYEGHYFRAAAGVYAKLCKKTNDYDERLNAARRLSWCFALAKDPVNTNRWNLRVISMGERSVDTAIFSALYSIRNRDYKGALTHLERAQRFDECPAMVIQVQQLLKGGPEIEGEAFIRAERHHANYIEGLNKYTLLLRYIRSMVKNQAAEEIKDQDKKVEAPRKETTSVFGGGPTKAAPKSNAVTKHHYDYISAYFDAVKRLKRAYPDLHDLEESSGVSGRTWSKRLRDPLFLATLLAAVKSRQTGKFSKKPETKKMWEQVEAGILNLVSRIRSGDDALSRTSDDVDVGGLGDPSDEN
jgi:hypothetical protein